MDDQRAIEILVRLQTRAIQDLSRRLEATERELAAVRAASERTSAVAAALLEQLQAQSRAGLAGFADRHPWPAFALAVLLLLGITGQLYLLPQLAPALGVVRAAP